jgi:hypothetical protein
MPAAYVTYVTTTVTGPPAPIAPAVTPRNGAAVQDSDARAKVAP